MDDEFDLLLTGPGTSRHLVALAHGAGAGMDTPLLRAIAEGLAECDVRVARFEFPYMSAQRQSGKRRPPDRAPVLLRRWREVISTLGTQNLVIGGKSMGGRLASLIADQVGAAGLVCLGYPFHPTGRPDKLRTEHLRELKTPTLILQGERDPLGNRSEVEQYTLSPQIQLHWLPDGDHSFKPRRASGRTEQQNWQEAVQAIRNFLEQLQAK